MKQVARVTLTILLTIALVVMFWLFSSAVLLFLMSLVIAAAVRPFAVRLMERGLSRSVAYGSILMGSFLVLIGLIVALTPKLLDEIQQASDALLQYYEHVLVSWPNGAAWQQRIVGELPSRQGVINALAGDRGTGLASTVIGFGSSVFDIFGQIVVVLSLSIYWASDQYRFERLWLSLVHPQVRPQARSIWRLTEIEMGNYIRSELFQSVLAGTTLGLSYAAIGLPYPIMLALWSAVTWLIPWLGVILALIPAVVVGITVSPLALTMAVLVTIIVFAAMEIWVEPRLYGRSRVSPVLVLIVLMLMAQYAGILGMLLAPPIAAAIQILSRELLTHQPPSTLSAELLAQIIDLRTRLAEVRLSTEGDEALDNQQTYNLYQRVNGLLDKTHATLDTNGMLDTDSATQPDPIGAQR